MKVSSLYIYPIKSLPGIELQSSEVDLRGLKFDRRWMLIDENNRFISQREKSGLLNFKLNLDAYNLIIEHTLDGSRITIPLNFNTSTKVKITIWDDTILASHVSSNIDDWFSDKLGIKCRLVFQADEDTRKIDEKYFVSGNEETSFSDGYPILIISEESLRNLNSKCPEAIEIERFRPNIVISNCQSHEEDELKSFEINSLKFVGVKPCARCIMTTINPKTQLKTAEPLKTLNTYRKIGNKIMFGQNVVVHSSGIIKIGDKLTKND